MKEVMQYNGYFGSIEYSLKDMVLHGRILFISDLVTYEADSLADLVAAFHEEVDDYIAFCKEVGKEPEKPFKGSFNVRIDPALHRAAAMQAAKEGINLNQFVGKALVQFLSGQMQTDDRYMHKLDDISVSVENLNQNFMAATAAGSFSNMLKIKYSGDEDNG